MRAKSLIALCLASVVLAAGVARAAPSLEEVDSRLADAKRDRAAAQHTLREAEDRLAQLTERYEKVRAELDLVVRDVVTARFVERSTAERLAEAQRELDRRAAEAYEAGPSAALELLFGSRSPADLASASVFAARAFGVGQEAVDEVVRLRASLEGTEERLVGRRADLRWTLREIEQAAADVAEQAEAAAAAADRAGLEVKRLHARQRELEEAQRKVEESLAPLVDSSRGRDQSELLALLGPNQGRGCDVPSGLALTGDTLAGESSWYGWDFAGQPTATGAIFDPRLFTAANKELPLNVFLRIHHRGKCAIVLVNDRGPYGVEGRIFDVAEAVAEYLGYKSAGVADVTADVLVAR